MNVIKRCKVCGKETEMHELNEHCSVKCHQVTLDAMREKKSKHFNLSEFLHKHKKSEGE